LEECDRLFLVVVDRLLDHLLVFCMQFLNLHGLERAAQDVCG
jgi:hypothetical protein